MKDIKIKEKQYDVFISYGRRDYEREYEKDGAIVKELIPNNPILSIVTVLEKEGITCWYDQEGVSAEFLKYIKQKIEASRIMIFVSSENSNQSEYTPDEIAHAKKLKMPIIPIKIDTTEFNEDFALGLASKNTIETFVTNPDKALKELVICVKRSLEQIYQEETKRKEDEARKKQMAKLNKSIAELGQKESEADTLRQEINTLIMTIDDIPTRKKYSSQLNDVGVLHQKSERAYTALIKTKSVFGIAIIVFISIIVLLTVFFLGKHGIDSYRNTKNKNEIAILEHKIDSLRRNDSLNQIKIYNLSNINDSLQLENAKNVIIPTLQVAQKDIELPSSKGCYSLSVKSNVKWGISKPTIPFVSLTQTSNTILINHERNITTATRNSFFDVSTNDGLKKERVNLSQKPSQDTLILLQPISIAHNAEQMCIDIRCPFRINYLDGNIQVRAKFLHKGKEINIPTGRENEYKEYFERDKATGKPLLRSKEYNFACKKSGNEHSEFSIIMPYDKFDKLSGNIKIGDIVCVVTFMYNNKILFTSKPLVLSK